MVEENNEKIKLNKTKIIKELIFIKIIIIKI